jgi:NAD(P) transhydrogenase
MITTHDVIVLGGGPAGERAAIQAARAGKKVALVERAHVVGGTCINWGTIPSKTLRESALFIHGLRTNRIEGIRCEIAHGITMADVMRHERMVVQRELELINRTLGKYQIEVNEGHGRFIDTHTVSVSGRDGSERSRICANVVVIATGSSPNRPADIRFDDQTVFDSNSILDLSQMPASMIVLGAGVIGLEYACIFAALGVQVTLVDTRDQLLPYLDREIVAVLQHCMKKLNIVMVQGEHYQRVESIRAPLPAVQVHTRGGRMLEADLLLYSVGRDGNTGDLGLDNIGLKANARGLLEVNEFYQTIHPHIYAVGDVIGYPALASTSAEQGRQAIRHAFGIPGPRGRTEALPFAIYAIPEVSFIGPSEEELAGKGATYVVGRGQYGLNPRGQIMGDSDGILKLLFDASTLRLLAAHVIGTHASELVHIGQAFLRNGSDAWQIAETLYNYPTLSDLYRHAALEGIAARRRDLESRGGIDGE